ncbi:MAG TPA: metal ABC transporter permease [Candidatus Dormibacteraeota bacterium]|nr:metal ABC transporter permease [Candidatus Dormibacteraeota bacterium]
MHDLTLFITVKDTTPQLTWNLVADLAALFQYQFMDNAYVAGTMVAVVAGAVGYFVVLRSSAFAAHALSHIGFAGATGAVVVALNPIVGLLAFTMASGMAIGALGNRLRSRDVTIGIVLAWTLGLGVLFISLYTGYAQEAYALLFGEILGISVQEVLVTGLVAAVALVMLLAMYRPLLYASVDQDLAQARGVPTLALSIAFMAMLALAVTDAVQVVGVLLIFALIVTPAAIAMRFTSRPGIAIPLSIGLSVAFTWLGLAIAYYSPHPVSFFITSLAFGTYLVARVSTRRA